MDTTNETTLRVWTIDSLEVISRRLQDLELIHDSGLEVELGSEAVEALRAAVTTALPSETGAGAWRAEESLPLELTNVELSADELAALRRIGVIGMVGAPKSGKDTIALAMREWVGSANLAGDVAAREQSEQTQRYVKPAAISLQIRAFSDPIMAEANAFLEAAGSKRVITPTNKSWQPYRKLLQTYGLERRRANPDYWVEKLREEVNALVGIGDVVILTGVRTPSDLSFVREYAVQGLAPVVWKVYRPGNAYIAEHAIERALDHVPDSYYDHVITNNENDWEGLVASVRRGLR